MSSNRHHAKPRSKGGQKKYVNGYKNVRRVDAYKHHAWHVLFSNLDAQEIADIINRVWLDPEYEFIVQKRKRGTRGRS